MNRYLIKVTISFILLLISTVTFAELIENEHYHQLKNPVSISGKEVSVVEFFSYGCPYCAKLEPEIEKWLAQKSHNVLFTRIAIPRKGKWLDYAKLYYALAMISAQESERITPLLYRAIHDQKLDLTSKKSLIDWTIKQGINRKQLEGYFVSASVDEKLNSAMKLAQDYQPEYVPSIFVNGKYQLILNSQNHYADMPKQLNALIQLAKQAK